MKNNYPKQIRGLDQITKHFCKLNVYHDSKKPHWTSNMHILYRYNQNIIQYKSLP